MIPIVDVAIVGLSARFEPGQDLAGWWRALVCKAPSEARRDDGGRPLREVLAAEALADAGVEPPRAGDGPGWFLDGAGVSGNLAAAIQALRAGTCDVALAGASIPGAGGVLALRRVEDVGRDRAYAVITECRSFRAGEDARPPPADSLGLLVVGAEAEAPLERVLGAVEESFGPRQGALPGCGLWLCPEQPEGSAGLAGCRSLMAAALAARHQVYPPLATDAGRLAGFLERSPFHAHADAGLWMHDGDGRRRAGVLLLDGEQRAWVTLEAPDGPAPPITEEWPSELLLLSAPDRGQLLARVRLLRERLEGGAVPSLRALARELAGAAHSDHRLAIIASSLADLRGKLVNVEGKLADASRPRLTSRSGFFYADPGGRVEGKLAFLFPGQGSQYVNMLRELSLYLPQVRAWLDQFVETSPALEECPSSLLVSTPPLGLGPAGQKIAERGLHSMEGGAQVSFVVSLALNELLAGCGVQADVMAGYSNGENSAMAASGAWMLKDRAELFAILRQIKEESLSADAAGRLPKGAALAVSLAARAAIERELETAPKQLYLAMDNCPGQVVLFGAEPVIEGVAARLRGEGALCFRLPFERAYHTPLFEKKARQIWKVWKELSIGPPRLPVYSCATAEPYTDDPAEIRSLVAGQLARPVRFRDTVERLYADGVRLFVEIAPGGMLTGFVNDTLQRRSVVTTPTSLPNRSDLLQLQQALALLFVNGRPMDLSPLFRGRSDGRAPAPAPPPTELLRGHQDLMQAFRQSQHRIAPLLAERAGRGEAEAEDPRWPLLGAVVERGPGHLTCRRRISLERDLYLADHRLGRERAPQDGLGALPVVPFTFCMEMMAQAATRLVGDLPVVELREVRGLRWLALDRGSLEVGLHAEVEAGSGASQPLVRVRLFELDPRAPGGRMPLFEGLVRLAERHEAPPAPRHEAISTAAPPRWHPREVYERLFFHGPRLQSLRAFKALGPHGLDMEVEVPPGDRLVAGAGAESLRLPAHLLDGLGQLVGYWLLEQSHMYFGVFPFSLRSFRQYRAPPPSGTVLLSRTRVKLSGGVTTQDCEFLDAQGQLVARAEGMQSRYFDFDHRFLGCLYWGTGPEAFLSEPLAGSTEGARSIAPLPAALFESGQGIWLRALAHMVLGEDERARWYELPPDGTERAQWVLDRVAAKEALRAWARDRLHADVDLRRIDLLPRGQELIARCPELEAAGPVPAVFIQRSDGRTLAFLRAPATAGASPPTREAHFQEQRP